MANNDELVEQFVDITKDTEDRARFFLEANNWTLEVYNLYRFGFFRFHPRSGKSATSSHRF